LAFRGDRTEEWEGKWATITPGMNQHEDIPVMKCTENALFFDA
jgi:hypothetical protein